ncbi:unnamed protein product [Blepharisma stoltei]|uniref:Protein transport protein SEC23 n=1 Tax=Blepharisma stoltei TaxID=1481888 RepID=A0AAU9JSV9_9CILI|nr:unnamed protein product [Blepharisma stoltei]
MTEDAFSLEAKDGVRCSWMKWPSKKFLADRIVVPVSVFYTPLKQIEGLGLVEYEPLFCNICKGVLNPYVGVDFKAKVWSCPLCFNKNAFPPHYKEYISESSIPSEMTPQFTTMEYILGHSELVPSIYLFIIDTCCTTEELNSLKSSIINSLSLIPENSYIGILTIGKNVFLYNLGWKEGGRCYTFKGDRIYDPKNIKDQLGINHHDPRGNIAGGRKFFTTKSESEFSLIGIIEKIKPDIWPTAVGDRQYRCTGTALNVAVSLLELAYPKRNSKILLFVAGVCTAGQGMIVSVDIKETIRTHMDIRNQNTVNMKPAIEYYKQLAKRAVGNGISVDAFFCAVDQTGILEMKSLCEETGGHIILTDSFNTEIFQRSLTRLLGENPETFAVGSDAVIQIHTEKNLGIAAKIGPGGNHVHDKTQKKLEEFITVLPSIDSNTTISYIIDFPERYDKQHGFYFLQFQTNYRHFDGRKRLRVTTVKFPIVNNDIDITHFIPGFDQESAAVAVARWAVIKLESKEPLEVIRWIDRTLVRLIKVFASYLVDSKESFKLCREFSLFPQFMFYMRRSQFLQTFNISPDESSYYRSLILSENITNSLLMVQPALLEYSFESPESRPVLLDIVSLKHDVILLMDSFFIVLVWHGDTIASWRKAEYQNKEGYEHFKMLLQLPLDDAQGILNERFPVPKFIVTDCGRTQDRCLKARVNPSTGGNVENLPGDGGNYLTDDANLKMFTDSMIEYVIKPQ